ncbi:hypothetical protein B0H14DRAFT_2587135 [Mycena olivaceomarginata]|nr:hypothetical protein B0H14DRAFT_2587135 [Mycena olivaceomarginata]
MTTLNCIEVQQYSSRGTGKHKRVPNNVMKKYCLQQALGGTGLCHSSTLFRPNANLALISAQYDRSPGIWNMEQVVGWRKTTNVVHLTGSKIYCQCPFSHFPEQLWYMGRLANSESEKLGPVYGPSAIQHSKRMDNMAAMSQLYGDANVDPCLGYTNYPAVTY